MVQATNPKGRSIQVAVLTDDTQRAASEILRLMFCRWVQENDFKYLDKHFGINQITSYGVVGYEELREQVEDRQVRSAEVKALGEQRRQLRARQGRLLLLQAKSEHEAPDTHRRTQRGAGCRSDQEGIGSLASGANPLAKQRSDAPATD